MAKDKSHVGQHFVPRFLLSEWAGEDKKLGVFKRLPNGSLRFDRRSPKAVAKLDHLYSIRQWTDEPDVFIEKDILGPHIDDIAAPVHQQILREGLASLTSDQHLIWSRLLLAGMFRLPFMVENFRELGREKVREQSGNDAMPDAEALDEGLKLFVTSIGSNKYIHRMRSAKWWLVKVPPGWKDALICDFPFAYFGDFFGTAFSLVLPISPRCFFVCASGEYIDNLYGLRPAWMISANNKRLVQLAEDYVYTTDTRHKMLVEKWLRFKNPVDNTEEDAA